MKTFLPDANVLIHALRRQSPDHERCRNWLVEAGGSSDVILLCELVEVALLRIVTLPKLNLVPIPDVLGYWKEDLLTYPGIRRATAGERHTGIFSDFIRELDLCGNDLNDAWLAAVAIEQGATLVSTDLGFRRFRGLNLLNPGYSGQRNHPSTS